MAYQGSPGPAHYKIPPSIGYKDHNKTKWIMPAYSIAKKPLTSTQAAAIPGPKYMTRDTTRFGNQKGPAFSIKKRTGLKMGSAMPGPGTYYPEKYNNRKQPLFSFGKRNPIDQKSLGPGPAGYNVRKDKPPGPAFNMLSRQPMRIDDKSPGPAAYNPKMDSVMKKVRAVKLSGRQDAAGGKGYGPGPGHYKYNTTGRSLPKFSFGRKHNERMTPYVVPEDNACLYKPRTD